METGHPHSPTSAAIVQQSLDLSHWLFANTPNQFTFDPVPEGLKERAAAAQLRMRHKLAVALFQIAIDHHTSIVFLCLHHMRSSAFALARTMFDSTWQGAWVGFAGPFELVERFAKGKYRPTANAKLIKRVDAALGSGKFFSRVYEQAWETLCSYTHTGHLQLGRWIGEDEISPKHTDEEMSELLRLCDQLALACALLLADIANSGHVAIQDKFQELFGVRPGPAGA